MLTIGDPNMLICCITVRFSSGKVKTYERAISPPMGYGISGRIDYATRVALIAVAFMKKRLEIEGSPTKVLGGWIRQ